MPTTFGRYADDDARWDALVRRDADAEGAFIVAVTSTRIYCRPGCPSRRPRRENVRFYASTQEAATAGFRACKRCRPDDDLPPPAELAARIRGWIDANIEGTVKLDTIASAAGVSPGHAQRTFTRVYGLSPAAYVRALRYDRVREALSGGQDVTTALYDAGLGSSSRLYERAPQTLGMTPGAYARRGEGQTIRYCGIETPLGRLLLAATERGLCAVRYIDDGSACGETAGALFPAACLHEDAEALRPYADVVRELIAGRPAALPALDLHGTAFQLQVWAALQRIPQGETRTYSEVAAEAGNPSAVRAAASACGDNPVPIVVPCHRVIRRDGTLGGYAGGPERKRALLAAEGSA